MIIRAAILIICIIFLIICYAVLVQSGVDDEISGKIYFEYLKSIKDGEEDDEQRKTSDGKTDDGE